MPEQSRQREQSPAVFTIPIHRSFADSLVVGLIDRFGGDPLALARGRILLPNNRAARTLTEAFVRASGSGLLLPRLIPIGDPELEERIGGALDPADGTSPVPPAIDPMERLFLLASIVREPGDSAAEAVRIAGEIAATMDSMAIEEVDSSRLAGAASDSGADIAAHWQSALQRFERVLSQWPAILAERGRIDLTDRRNRLLRAIAERWRTAPPSGFTVAAGITTAAPAVAALLGRVARMDGGMLVLPGLSLEPAMSEEEWEALGPDEPGRGEETHPQFHLKLLLDRIGVARGEVRLWPRLGQSASSPIRSRAIANAMTAARFTAKWRPFVRDSADSGLPAVTRRLSGIRLAELSDPAAEAQAIALALRQAVETEGRTAALVTPDRQLARRVSALLRRWGIEADDSAGRPLSELAPGTLLLGIAAAAAEDLAPVALLAMLKHPLAGGDGEQRLNWLDDVRLLDLALRGPRPGAGIDGLDRHFEEKERERQCRGCLAAWRRVRGHVEPLTSLFAEAMPVAGLAEALAWSAESLAGNRCWMGAEGRAAAKLLSELKALGPASALDCRLADAPALLRQLLDQQRLRPAFGGHPRIAIWGLLEARLQQSDLLVLGGLNEGVWPALPAPDPWLAPRIRANLGLPGLEFRIGLAAHDFASALGARDVLITRAFRDSRSPTVASRLLLRLEAMSGGLARDHRIERIAAALDRPGETSPAERPKPSPSAERRPNRISVTAVDRLKADPFAFYAQAILGLRSLDPVDSDYSPAWKGTAVHKVLEQWLLEDGCDPDRLPERTEAFLAGSGLHPMLRALWAPRLTEAIRWIAELERDNRRSGRRPLAAEIKGSIELGGIRLEGKADRIDRLAGGGLGIVDYKTGKAPARKAIDAGFALQLGLLGLIAEGGGFDGIDGSPELHEYWSLAKGRTGFGSCLRADKEGAGEFLDRSRAHFLDAAERWLTGTEPFVAKLNPAFAPYGDYDQLMRLEEWYGRQ